MAAVLALTVFAGFAPTYYLRLFSGGPRATVTGGPFTPMVHVHGALFTSWVLLYVAQTALIARRRVAAHRRMGIAGAVLAAAMVVAGMVIAIGAAARGAAPPGVDPLAFLIIPFTDMVLFAGFLAAALARRRSPEAHKRLMLLAYVNLMVAAVARLPGVLPLGPPAYYGLALLFILAGALYDRLSRGRVHAVYVWGGALFVASVPARLLLSGTGAWRALAQLLTS
jgi:hypothetical protein